MGCTSSIVRKLMKGGSLAFLGLLVPTLVFAAPASHRGGARVCDPSAVTLRKLARVARTAGGPLAHPTPRIEIGLSDGIARVQRARHSAIVDDDEAIQNDAPAAWHGADLDLAPGFEALERVARTCIQPTTHEFSPRSPRGPPLAG